MPEHRTDPLTGRQVLIAENRAGRPYEFSPGPAANVRAEDGSPSDAGGPDPDCPFCPGNEGRNPAPLHVRNNAAGDWTVRVVPNLFPTVAPVAAELTASKPAAPNRADSTTANDTPADHVGDGLWRGGHEVIIETRRHVAHTTALDEPELREVLEVYAQRMEHYRGDARLPYRLLFKNVGPAAGASLRHLHSQVIALPAVPPLAGQEHRRLAEHHAKTGDQPWRCWLDGLLSSGVLIVAERGGVVACCPPVSRFSHETWLMPTSPSPYFEDVLSSPEQLSALASLMGRLLSYIENQLGADYNVMVHTAPLTPGAERWFDWRIEITPRTGYLAGFELPTGMFVNTVAPEQAAPRLRSALASEA